MNMNVAMALGYQYMIQNIIVKLDILKDGLVRQLQQVLVLMAIIK